MLINSQEYGARVHQAVADQLEHQLDQLHAVIHAALVVGDRRRARRASRWVLPIQFALLTLQEGVEIEPLNSGAWVVRASTPNHIVCRVVERDGLPQWFCCCCSYCWSAALLAALEALPVELDLPLHGSVGITRAEALS